MNLLPEKIGGTRKQYMWLGGLVVVLIAVYFLNREPSSAPATQPAAAIPLDSGPIPAVKAPSNRLPTG